MSRVIARIGISFSIALAAAVVVPSAQAANIVPNPGFEMECAGDPCNWFANTFATIDRVTANPHSGFASMQVTTTLSNSGALSECVNTTASGTIIGSFWYRTSDPNVTNGVMGGVFYTGANCMGMSTGSGNGVATNNDGQWHQLFLPIGVPANTNSVYFFLQHNCSPCDGGVTVFYDDVVFDVAPTPVTFRSLSATRSRTGVVVRWRTEVELDTLGFNLYRQQRSKLVRLNRALIPAVFGGTTAGHAYSWLDRGAAGTTGKLRYRLQAVDLDGTRSWVGAVDTATG